MKNNVIKKFAFPTLVFIYDIVSLIWCYVILCNLVYVLSLVSLEGNSIGIIGAADTPTTLFLVGKFLKSGFSILFILLSIATALILTVSMFRKKTNHKVSILLCVFLTFTLIIFVMIPVQSYIVSLYDLVIKLPFLKYIKSFYIILSLLIIVKSILFVIKEKGKKE